MHESSGRLNDISGGDNHASLSGGISQGSAGRGGLTSYRFGGIDGSVQNSAFNGQTVSTLTVSLWYKTGGTDLDAILRLENINTNGLMRIDHNVAELGKPRLWWGGGGSVDAVQPAKGVYNDNEWHHLVVSRYDTGAENMDILIDGEFVETETLRNNGSGSFTLNYFLIGENSSNRYWDGNLADVRVYNRRLSPSEVQHLYEIGSVDVATPPAEEDSAAVARYAFDDRSDPTTALDTFGANDGTINGAVYSSDSIRGLATKYGGLGSADHIELSNFGFGSTSQPFTINVWAKPDGANFGRIMSRGYVDGSSKFWFFQSHGTDGGFNVGINDGNNVLSTSKHGAGDGWRMVTMRFGTEPSVSIYINGVLKEKNTGNLNDFSGAESVYISEMSGENPTKFPFEGRLDDIRVYSRALSDYEVQQLYLWGTRGIDMRHNLVRQ
jgi:hypothetical protein